MNPRDTKEHVIGYTFNLEELVIVKSAMENNTIKAYIQTLKANYITEHIMTPLLDYQGRGPDIKLNMALNEAYLKGAIDFATELLNSVTLPGEDHGPRSPT